MLHACLGTHISDNVAVQGEDGDAPDDASEASSHMSSRASSARSSKSGRSSRSSRTNKTRSSTRVPKEGDPWEGEYLETTRVALIPTQAIEGTCPFAKKCSLIASLRLVLCFACLTFPRQKIGRGSQRHWFSSESSSPPRNLRQPLDSCVSL
jgi:hypothetical protein